MWYVALDVQEHTSAIRLYKIALEKLDANKQGQVRYMVQVQHSGTMARQDMCPAVRLLSVRIWMQQPSAWPAQSLYWLTAAASVRQTIVVTAPFLAQALLYLARAYYDSDDLKVRCADHVGDHRVKKYA